VSAAALAAGGCAAQTPVVPDLGQEDAPPAECTRTPATEQGPSYLSGAPERAALAELNVLNWPGSALEVVGLVLAPDCRTPLAGTLLDVWSADAGGEYDGGALDPDGDPAPDPAWPLRGRVRSDATGHFQFRTLFPGPMGDRTRQIGLIATADGYPTLTTRIYFLGEPANDTDEQFERALAVAVHDHGAALHVVVPVVLSAAP
jgi:catechol 1,2-dioxygenase